MKAGSLLKVHGSTKRGRSVQGVLAVLQLSLGIKPVLGLCSPSLRVGGHLKDPKWYKGSDFVAFSVTGSLEETYFKVCKAQQQFMYLGMLGSDVVCENRK